MSLTTQKDFDALERVFKNNCFEEVKKILQNFDITASDSIGMSSLMLCCENSSSLAVMKLVFDKVVEVGGNDLLKKQLVAADSIGTSCLMYCCEKSLSLEVTKLVFQRIVEVGGPDTLKHQLTATDTWGSNCLQHGLNSPEIVKIIASLLLYFDLFKEQFERLKESQKNRLKEVGINSASWTPWCDPKTTLEALNLLFSDITRIGGGDQFLKNLLLKESATGETCLFSVCLRAPERLEFIMDKIEEVCGEDALVEQIKKKRQFDGMTCLYALCKSAPRYEILALLVRKIFQLEHGRGILRLQLNANPCLECILSPMSQGPPHVSPGERLSPPDERKLKVLFLFVSIYSMTGLFEEYYYSRLNEEKRIFLRNFCKIESGDWSRTTSNDSILGDVIGEIKKSTKTK